MSKFIRLILLALLLPLLAACGQANHAQKFNATDITGVDFGNTLQLTDHTGKARTLSDFKGKVVALFFGYTHCPDVCPTTLADLKQAKKLLGEHAEEFQVLFVTLDPARDTQALLKEYVPAFDPSFLGLYGTQAQTDAVLKDFKIFAAKVENNGRSGYTIDHSAGVYVFDKTGKIRLYVDYGAKPDLIAGDIQKLL